MPQDLPIQTGTDQKKTLGWIVLKPDNAEKLGLLVLVMVPPTGAP